MLCHEKQIHQYEKTISELKKQNHVNGFSDDGEVGRLEKKLEELKGKVYSDLTPWERVSICRHPDRPRAAGIIKNICEDFIEIFGDRLFRDDHSIITGFCTIKGQKMVLIAQDKGTDTESRIYRNFGSPHPEGYRKAKRAMKLAEKFQLPVLTLIDTPGAYPGLSAEERGQGGAIAANLYEMARLKTPILAIIIGEGCSGGALGIGMGDVVAMLEHAYYSVISPEGCASILWHDASHSEKATAALKIHAEELIELKVVDAMIKEPLGGAHHDPQTVYKNLIEFITQTIHTLKKLPTDKLLDQRYDKFRKMGEVTIQGSA
ncbi:MAG: acetyl-CoA carboxylase carboxyltransferase subunit alpha [Simkaniaceae bacterium]|nr:acetyl-CoA carboxylase carboxyltransferase subunit alpha [Simkaniaceae bacterium]